MLEPCSVCQAAGGGGERARDRRGCVMVAAADYRMMARGPGRIGIRNCSSACVPVVPLEIMRFSAPRQYLQAMAYRGLTLTAEAALQHGLVDEVGDAERLLDEAVSTRSRGQRSRPQLLADQAQMRAPTRRRMRAAARSTRGLEAWSSPAA